MRKHGICFNIAALFMGFCVAAAIPQGLFAEADDVLELLDAGSFEKAESRLQDTLKKDPGNTTMRYYLGIALMQQKKFTEALQELKTVKSEQEKAGQGARPEVPSVYQIDLALGWTHVGLKQYREAWPKLESARIEDPDSSYVFLYRGVYYFEQKDYGRAIKDLEKAIKLDPENAYAYYHAGMVYFEMQEYDKMGEVFKIFLQLAPGAPEAPDVKKRVDQFC